MDGGYPHFISVHEKLGQHPGNNISIVKLYVPGWQSRCKTFDFCPYHPLAQPRLIIKQITSFSIIDKLSADMIMKNVKLPNSRGNKTSIIIL